MKIISILIFLFIIQLPLLAMENPVINGYEQVNQNNNQFYLNYDDLKELSQQSHTTLLDDKLNKQLNTPIINQSLGKESDFLHGKSLHSFFRVASWNIERGFNVELIEKIFQYPNTMAFPWESLDNETKKEIEILSKAQVIFLNEVDIGLPRTKYENIVKRLANALMSGYSFGTEFVEIDPYQLGIKKFTKEERAYLEDQVLEQLDNINKEKFLGLHGNAILSKYPILSARIIRLPVCYDWYKEEANKLSALELVRRETAQAIFSSKVLTELRAGSRIAVVADLLLPNKQTITAVAVHLENRCPPECREKQLEFLLKRLRNIKNPVIIGGDFNTTGADASPVSIKKEVLKRVKDPTFIASQALLSLTPITVVQNFVLGTANAFRQFKDPTTKNIPIILPNKERKLFDLVKEFRFNDGNAFDIRGVPEKTHNGNYALFSNSNERELKGFKPTFELERHLGVAKYKLDWFFVKPLNLKDPNDKRGSSAYAPHFGRTLQLVNKAFGEKISDHDPITVDVPVEEPQ